jgi:hypothetical protein
LPAYIPLLKSTTYWEGEYDENENENDLMLLEKALVGVIIAKLALSIF